MPAALQAVGPRYPASSSRTGRSSVNRRPWAPLAGTATPAVEGCFSSPASPLGLTWILLVMSSPGEVAATALHHEDQHEIHACNLAGVALSSVTCAAVVCNGNLVPS